MNINGNCINSSHFVILYYYLCFIFFIDTAPNTSDTPIKDISKIILDESPVFGVLSLVAVFGAFVAFEVTVAFALFVFAGAFVGAGVA